MADIALAQALGQMEIEKKVERLPALRHADHHVLSLSYPDFSIPVPLNEHVEFTAPAKMEHRSRPPHDSRELALYDTNFELALPLREHGTCCVEYMTEYMRLFAAVEALRSESGKTIMGVLRLHHEIWDESVFRVRLETHWVGPFPKMPPQDFELSGADWEALLSFAADRPWIGLLQHLVERASAKAYYHVRQRIMARCGPQGAEQEEKLWSTIWGTKRAIYATDLFLRNLTLIHENVEIGAMPQLMLDCGHAYHLSCQEALKVNGNVVFRKVCHVCAAPIMKPEDRAYLDATAENNNVWKFTKMQRVWVKLVQDAKEAGEPRKFHAMSIFRILGAALDSLRCPEWVAPATICPSNFEETSLVLEHLESMFWDSNQFYERTAEQLLEDLEKEALGVRIDDTTLGERVNPPGWDDFVARWLRRTAYFLAYRRCDGGGYECKGLHGHWDGLWYCPEVWERQEAAMHENKDSSSDTDELAKALEAIAI